MNFFKLSETDRSKIKKILKRTEVDISEYAEVASKVIEDVKCNGDDAVFRYTKEFDKVVISAKTVKVTKEEFKKGRESLDSEIKEAIEYSYKNIEKFHKAQMPKESWMMEVRDGLFAGEKVTAITSAGLYVPRGKGAFPSVLLMLATPAMVAGVEKVIVCTPPNSSGGVDSASLFAAELCGVKDIYKVGGIQAIAAMAYGTRSVPKVDKMMGPGNAYVSAAKRILFGVVDVGLPAGPSESVILADEHANAEVVALDLLIEAEHGPDSSAVLVTHSEKLAVAVRDRLPELIKDLPEKRQDFCNSVFSNYGGIVITNSLEESIKFVNEYAPEHMEILTKHPFDILGKIKNAGEILLGSNAPITIANFSLGPNAVLPTGGFAKTFSPVSVREFIKRSSFGYATKEGYNDIKDKARVFAEFEGFPAHAAALSKRPEIS